MENFQAFLKPCKNNVRVNCEIQFDKFVNIADGSRQSNFVKNSITRNIGC